ncbi:MAG: T9SS type A sorting domain-containing protein [Bacteroidota bacterium]
MRRIATCILILISVRTLAQNLVPNCSFEINNNCPTGTSQISFAVPWTNSVGTPDYFNSCGSSFAGTPANFVGYQYAKKGVAYAGFYTFVSGNVREYIQVQLIDSLKKDSSYCVKFYVSLANQMRYANSTIGAYFSKTPVSNTKDTLLPYIPQINNTAANPLTDTAGWTLVSGNFIAAGGEQYITMGNFNTNATSDTTFIGGSGFGTNHSYYYIDSVTVMLCSDTAISVNEINNEDFKIYLYPNPSDGNILLEYIFKQNGILNIYDVTGKLIEEYELNANRGELQINTNLSNGIYLYQVIVNDRIVKSDKLVVIK